MSSRVQYVLFHVLKSHALALKYHGIPCLRALVFFFKTVKSYVESLIMYMGHLSIGSKIGLRSPKCHSWRSFDVYIRLN
jgi:hypothetical protein